MKIRTIITQDAEVDDQNSLRHFLLYANEVDVQGIIQTSSKFHWIGVPGAVKPENAEMGDFIPSHESGPYDEPYRWPGTDWMSEVLDDYEKDYPNLCKHAEGYPTPDYLRSITKIGNIGYEGEVEEASEGSDLIKERILDDDERKLYLQVWGGTNTIARAFMDIESEYEDKAGWDKLREKIVNKVVITACGEQDGAYKGYMAEKWPEIPFVKTLQMKSYAYAWFINPESDSKDTLKSEFMKKEILDKDSALIKGYCTWLDGHRYEGEEESSQFGTNPDINSQWFGAKMGFPPAQKYDFLSEGDSPTYFILLPWGTRTLEDFSFGGMAGRYHRVEEYVNSKGEPCNVWDVSMDSFTDKDGNVTEQESMWVHVAEIQRDFAARATWAATSDDTKCEHAPKLSIAEGCDFEVEAGEEITVHAKAENPDKLGTRITMEVYKEASGESLKAAEVSCTDSKSGEAEGKIRLPQNAKSGEKLHVVVKAQSEGHYKLTYYQQIIVTVK